VTARDAAQPLGSTVADPPEPWLIPQSRGSRSAAPWLLPQSHDASADLQETELDTQTPDPAGLGPNEARDVSLDLVETRIGPSAAPLVAFDLPEVIDLQGRLPAGDRRAAGSAASRGVGGAGDRWRQ
jgi:hypothetical protein